MLELFVFIAVGVLSYIWGRTTQARKDGDEIARLHRTTQFWATAYRKKNEQLREIRGERG